MRQALVVIDQDLALDRRVTLTIAGIERAGYRVTTTDIRQPQAWRATPASLIRFVRLLFVILARGIVGLPRLASVWRRWDCRRYGLRILSSPRVIWRRTLRPLWRGAAASSQYRDVGLVIANDLEALIFAAAAMPPTAELYYDSHELNLFRARERNSVLRIATDFAFETACIRRARRIFTVSEPIVEVLKELHAIAQVEYRPNAFYSTNREPVAPPHSKRLHILYAGAAAPGRQLESLAALAAAEPSFAFTLHIVATASGYRLPEPLSRLSNVSLIEGSYSDDDMDRLTAGGDTIFMWCVIDDICLSYRLAEPSKYHQAVALGYPVIVGAHQTLAEKVRRDGNGIVLIREELSNPRRLIGMLKQGSPDTWHRAARDALQNYKQFQFVI